MFDEDCGSRPAQPVIAALFLDRPSRRFVRARHALQGESARFGAEQQLMAAEAAQELTQPRCDVRPVAGGDGTHTLPPRWNALHTSSRERKQNANWTGRAISTVRHQLTCVHVVLTS